MKIKHLLYLFLVSLLACQQAYACAQCDQDGDYYDIFPQEIVQTDDYYDFLVTYNAAAYSDRFLWYDTLPARYNGNIKEWATYLNIQKEQAYYLVMKATNESLDSLMNF